MEQALGTTCVEELLDQCSLRLYAADIPIWRTSLGFQILHPLYEAISLIWYRESGLKITTRFVGTKPGDDWLKSSLLDIVSNKIPFLRLRTG